MLHFRDATWQCDYSIHFSTGIGFHISHTWIYFALPQCKASSQGCATYQCFSSIPSRPLHGSTFVTLWDVILQCDYSINFSTRICFHIGHTWIVPLVLLFHFINRLSNQILCLRFGLMLFNLCAGMVKQRTCFTNYAPLWANMKFLHDNFRLAPNVIK